ncbi:MAG: hypothetical protein OQK04_08880 [Kangiellaceae bacterium]|nr:hypothetical protein [Kangiellaceae bacterium]MCW8998813.1 hypothetical protein [Kangiellaceae bacterium]
MDFWKKLHRDATRYFNSQQYHLAIDKYNESLEQAMFLYGRWHKHEEVVQHLISSLQCLCESYIQVNEHEKGGNTILKGIRLTQNLIQYSNEQHSRKEDLIKASKQLKSYLAYLLAEYPQIEICQSCYRKIFGNQAEEQQVNYLQ